jgi:dTDP-4-amino-4,6-dideoxygalactose transaminase
VCADYGAAGVTLTSSGTGALALAMIASAGDGRRPRVAMPAWGCSDLMTAADIVDAEVILYDLDEGTLAPSAASFAAALAQRPAAVVVAHWFGLPVVLEPLLAAAHAAGATLIEDAAQGIGGMIGDKPLGALGDFGVLSFNRGKGRTGGCGGALLANSASASDALERVTHRVGVAPAGKRALIALAAQWALARPWAYALPASIPSLKLGETVYHPPSPIRAMPEWAAAVVGALWAQAERESAERRRIGARWDLALAQSDSVCAFAPRAGTTPGWLRYPVLVNGPASFLGGDARKRGIMTAYKTTLADLPLNAGRLVNSGPWPGAVQLAARIRTLPSHSLVRSDELAAIVSFLEAADGSHRRGPGA